jgi:hypothetical protein
LALFAHVLIVLGGCSGVESGPFAKPQDLSKVDPNLFPPHYQEQVTAFLRGYLSNPTKVKDAFIAEPVLRPVAGTPRYVTCVRYNPRDAEDRYQGGQTKLAIFLSGQLNQFLPADPQTCANLAYQRFPEAEAMVP